MNIDNIVNEEISKFLNESYIMTDDRFKFAQRINNSTFYNYESFTTEFDTDIVESDIVVNWTASFWLNQMGFENFIIDVTGVQGTFNLQMFDKHTDELKQDTPKNIQEYEWKFVINDATLEKGGALYISTLDFDFANKTCTVSF